MRRCLLVIALAVAACGSKQPKSQPTAQPAVTPLYDRLGKLDAIKAIVKDFVEERVAKDVRINGRFANTDVAHLEQMLAEQICEATGGPCKYTGETMKEVHAGIGVTEAEFRALVEDLVASLDKFGVPKAEQDELIGKLATMHDDIVEKK
jgi:hemoglobin